MYFIRLESKYFRTIYLLGVEDINKSLQEIIEDLQKRVYKEEIKSIVTDQAIINESLCNENILGRWLWRSGEVKNGSLVPWEIQVLNTFPENFLWEKDKTSLLVVSAGLYEVNYGFFSYKKPSIQLLVNGE